MRLCKMVIPWSFSGVSPTAVLSREAQVLPFSSPFLDPCLSHPWILCFLELLGKFSNLQVKKRPPIPTRLLGNARWITAAIPFHPLSRIEASSLTQSKEMLPQTQLPLNCSCKILSLLCCLWCLCSLEGSWQKTNAVREVFSSVSQS